MSDQIDVKTEVNEKNIIFFYDFLDYKNQAELRLIEPRWKNKGPELKPIQKWVNSKEEFLREIKKYNGEYNMYVGINERKELGDKDKDIKFITNIGHDIDAHSGRAEDFMKAQEIALKIKEDCLKKGYNEPLVLCSGRGFWVIHHILPMENNDENVKKIKEFGKRIKEKYESEGVELDSAVYNPSRIARIPGTLNISNPTNFVESFIINNPVLEEDKKLFEDILNIELRFYPKNISHPENKDACAFLDYCLSHEIPKGERHRVISRNMSLYISNNPDRGLLKEQYFKIQKGSETELNQWLKNIDENDSKNYPFSCGELINFQKKYKIPLKCYGCRKFKKWKDGKKIEERNKEINKIFEKKDYSELQKEIMTLLLLRKKDDATELIVEEIKNNNHIFTTKDDLKSEMWIYNQGVYRPEGRSEVKEIVRKILGKIFNSNICNQIITKIEADTQIEQNKFFRTKHLGEIPLKNGILNIFTKELKPFDPKKVFFNKLPIEYDPDIKCPNILSHFETVLKSKDDAQVILELFGFMLLKEYRIEKAFMFVGKGRNGKSKTLELMKRFLGPENCSNLTLNSMKHDSFSLSEIFGKMSNLAGDLSNTDLKETGTIKNLIGRDTIQAKRKFLKDLNFVNYAKLVFAANELPRVYDTTDGFWTKWILLEFPYKFIPLEDFNNLNEEERKSKRVLNPNIIKKLCSAEELSGLLNLALEGLDRLIKNGDFSYSKGTKDVKDLWIRQSDSFTAFCMDNIIEDNLNILKKRELRNRYFNYCKKHKLKGCSDKSIKITLQNNYGAEDGKKYIEGQYEYVWEGIRLRNISK